MFNNIKSKFNSILPAYTHIPLLCVFLINVVAFYATRLISRNYTHYDLSLPIDKAIPFVSVFIVIYVLAYVQWIVGFILIARESANFCYKYMSAEIISKLICLFIFLVIPTTMTRADIVGDDFLSNLTRLIYSVDSPDNLLPSLHCLESWFCFRGAFKMKKTGKIYTYFSFVFTLLVFASTVFVKQHVSVDIIAGVVVLEIGLFIAEKTNSALIFEKINASFAKNNNGGSNA